MLFIEIKFLINKLWYKKNNLIIFAFIYKLQYL